MDNLLLAYISILIISYGFLHSFYVMIKNKSAKGVSTNAYKITIIAALYILIFSESKTVFNIYLTEFILGIVGWVLTEYYHYKENYQLKETKKRFYNSICIFIIWCVWSVTKYKNLSICKRKKDS